MRPAATSPIALLLLGAALCALNPIPAKASKDVAIASIYFSPNTAEVPIAERWKLDVLLCTLAGREIGFMVVEGHAASDETQPLSLSRARAARVLQVLMSTGAQPEEWRPVGKGSKQPVASNRTAEGRQFNRRADVEIGFNFDKKRPVNKCEHTDRLTLHPSATP